MNDLQTRIQALRDRCEGVIAASKIKLEYSPSALGTPKLWNGENLVATVQSRAYGENIEMRCNMSEPFARATLKTLDWLESDMKADATNSAATQIKRNTTTSRLESILSEFGI